MEEVSYKIVFMCRGVQAAGAGPVASVVVVDETLPPFLFDPYAEGGGRVLGTWRLAAADDERLAFYELEVD